MRFQAEVIFHFIAIIQARIAQEQQEIQPLVQRLLEHKKELVIATHAKEPSKNRIRKLAAEQSHIMERLIVANSRLQQDIYRILTAEQRQKLDRPGQETVEVTIRLFAQQ